MSGNRLLLDSNIVIYLSKQLLSIEQVAQPDDSLFVSLITYMEVVGYPFSDTTEQEFVEVLFSSLYPLPITQSIANRVVAYRKIRKIKLPDAIILAKAREYDCRLVTRNSSDFEEIDDAVSLINPFSEPDIF